MTLVEQELENVNSRTVQLVKLLTEIGPDKHEISRQLGQLNESYRYRYNEKIINRGEAVQAGVDHEKLGLKRLMLIAEVSDLYKNFAQSIFTAMHELCYVVGFAKTLIGGEYIINLSVPSEHIPQIRSFFMQLKEKGMFSQLEILGFDWLRNVPMKPEFYDFDTGRWDFDWQKEWTDDFESAAYAPSNEGKFDFVDLLIMKELQMDANKSLKEISEKLGVNYKKLAWHHTTHVLAKRMLSGFKVNWMGTKYDYTLDKALHRKHKYFAVDLFVRDAKEFELMTLRRAIDRLPFLWGEACGGNYFAEFAFPVDVVVEGLQYIGKITSSVKDRTRIYPIDQTEAVGFTIPYQMYSTEAKKWTFNPQDLGARFDQLMVQIKNGAS